MKPHIVVLACILALGITARAQQTDQILQFEITKNGELVGTPQVWLKSGMVGRINMDSADAPNAPRVKGMRERITLTPTIQGDNISIAFDITSADKRFQPSLAISKDVKGALEWVNIEGHAIRLTVAWVN